MKQKSYPLLREAYAIIDGIPDHRFDLERFANSKDVHCCGTIACAAGWLAMHPKFQALGLELEVTEWGGVNIRGSEGCWDQILSRIFGIPVSQAHGIFGARWVRSRLNPATRSRRLTDKQLWQFRVRKFLELNP